MASLNHSYISSLVIRAQHGDSDAFAELYSMTYKHSYNYAGHYLRDPDLAQDAVQETYIAALKNIKRIKEPSLFVAWINQICFHVCYDMVKKNKSDYEVSSPELLEFLKDEIPDHNPEGQYENNEERISLKSAIAALPINERQVIVMKYYNEMKLEEIASALDCSRSSVKRYLISARENIAQMMGKES